MSKEVAVILTGNEKKLVEALAKSEARFKKLGENAQASTEDIDAAIEKMVKGAVDGMNKASVSINDMGKELGRMGKEGRAAKDAMEKHLQDMGKFGRRPVADIIKEFEKIDPKIAAVMREASEKVKKLETAADETDLSSLVGKLSDAKGAAGDLATLYKSGMIDANIAAEGGVDKLIAKIESADPAMKAVTQQWRKEWNLAADKADAALGENLATIREMGPAGEKAADQLVREYQNAGRLSSAAVSKILAPLDRTDEKVRKSIGAVEKAAKDSTTAMAGLYDKMSTKAIGHLTAVSGAYLGIDQAIQKVTESLENQAAVLDRSRDTNFSIAEAQSNATANLSSLNPEVRRELLEDFSMKLGDEMKLSKEGRVNVIQAIGDSQSSGAVDVTQVKDAVRVASELNRFSQDKIAETAAALIKASKATGTNDFKALASQLFAGQEKSQIISPEKFLLNIPRALLNANVTALPGMEKQAAVESLALNAVLSRAGGDQKGESTSTASIQVQEAIVRAFDLFRERTDQAREDLKQLRAAGDDILSESAKNTMADLKRRRAGSAANQQAIAQTEFNLSGVQDILDGPARGQARKDASIQARDLRAELSRLKSDSFDSSDDAQLKDLLARQEKGEQDYRAKELALLKTISDGQFRGKDIADLRIGSVLSDIKLLRETGKGQMTLDMLGPFGEQPFRGGIRQLFTGGAAADEAGETLAEMKRAGKGTERFDTITSSLNEGATSQQRLALREKYREAAESQQDVHNTSGARLSQLRKDIASIVSDTNRGYGVAAGIEQSINFTGPGSIMNGFGLEGNDVLNEGVDALFLLSKIRGQNKRHAMKDGVASETERVKIERLDKGIASVVELLKNPETYDGLTPSQTGSAQSTIDNKLDLARRQASKDGVISPGERRTIELLMEIKDAMQANASYQEEATGLQRSIASSSQVTASNTTGQQRGRSGSRAVESANNLRSGR